ncbi:MAG: hypothetical protein ACREJR_09270 [Candidatus Rokuibacteriota bacterium]
MRCPQWLITVALTVAIGLVVAAGASRRAERPAETWTALFGAGDDLATGRLTATLGGQPLTARKAYLLAFHQAQDAGDVEHMLAVADRLDAIGDADLAAHVRRAADTLLGQPARR